MPARRVRYRSDYRPQLSLPCWWCFIALVSLSGVASVLILQIAIPMLIAVLAWLL